MSARSVSALLSAGKLALALSTVAAVAPVGYAQSIQAQSSIAGASGIRAQGNAIASPTDRPPVIDGRDDDPIWKSATAITGFRLFDPKEDGDPTLLTEAPLLPGYTRRARQYSTTGCSSPG